MPKKLLVTGNFRLGNSDPSRLRTKALSELFGYNEETTLYFPISRPLSFGKVLKIIKTIFCNKEIDRVYIYNKSFLTNLPLCLCSLMKKKKLIFDFVEYGEKRHNKSFFQILRTYDEKLSIYLPRIFNGETIAISHGFSKLFKKMDLAHRIVGPILPKNEVERIQRISRDVAIERETIGIITKLKYEDDAIELIKKLAEYFPEAAIKIIGTDESPVKNVVGLKFSAYDEYIKALARCSLLIVPRRKSKANSFSAPTRLAEIQALQRVSFISNAVNTNIDFSYETFDQDVLIDLVSKIRKVLK